ncbi:MAG: zinc ribbon domain-containing protein [Sphaerochaetaceae bacterium]|nr:zinc ribbon domain-containing protein [Sphaerochaetaceae bacterium]
MARYDFKCSKCKKELHIEQPMSEDLPTDCPYCKGSGTLRQIYHATPILFKGEGFYCKDTKKA